jgi:glycerol-3-phosphate dehydrogenase
LNRFSANSRQVLINELKEGNYDLLVIGGGITGAGIALDAASRGLSVCLLEMQDFAGGTSSRSTRLIHGGLRYLKQFEFKLVSEVSKERKIIFKNAPHLVKPELLLLPITTTGSFGKFMTRLGMRMYELLAGVKKQERHRFLNVAETAQLEPLLKKEGLLGSILYYEYRTDDARLTISVLKKAVGRGALALSYMKVTGFNYKGGKITGVKVHDQLGGDDYEVKAQLVVNASGPWVDELDTLDDKDQGNKLLVTKGVHLVFDGNRLPLKQAVYFDAPDKRMIFALPHRGKTYVGTTDTFYEGEKTDPAVTDDDKSYLLKCINGYFHKIELLSTDIESCWAGLRPLIRKAGKKPSEISRRDEMFVWKSGLISIAGGKLTGYRKMAQRVVDLVAKQISATGENVFSCSTADIFLAGGETGPFPEFLNKKMPEALFIGLNKEESKFLITRYGSETDSILKIVSELKVKEPSHELPLLIRSELIYAVEKEMCLTPSDFFIRRTGMLYFDIDAVNKYKSPVVRYMQDLLGWSMSEKESYEKSLNRVLSGAESQS